MLISSPLSGVHGQGAAATSACERYLLMPVSGAQKENCEHAKQLNFSTEATQGADPGNSHGRRGHPISGYCLETEIPSPM